MARVAYSNPYSDEDENLLYWEEQRMRKIPGAAGDGLRSSQSSMFEKSASSRPIEFTENPVPGDPTQKVVSIGVGIANLFAENLLAHPCTVIRRQCQVHRKALRYHRTPFTLFPVIINLQKRQGISTLWKGLGSVFIMKGITLGTEDILSKFTPWPKETSSHYSWRHTFQHLMLKSIGFIVITPFYSSSFVETVQSDIASDKPGIFDCVKEGLYRLLNRHSSETSRLLSVWILVGPTLFYSLLQYVLSTTVHYVALRTLHVLEVTKKRQKGDYTDVLTPVENCDIELKASFTGKLLADVLLFPLETVVHRLHLQGTRTIIDNLDSGLEVVPVITKYEGAVDCFRSIVHEEGMAGLFKGFGALIIQYAIHAAILKLTRFLLTELRQSKEQ